MCRATFFPHLLTLTLVFSSATAKAQDEPVEPDEREIVESDDEPSAEAEEAPDQDESVETEDEKVVVADEEEVVVADEEEVIVAEEEEVVTADEEEVVAADEEEVVAADEEEVVAGDEEVASGDQEEATAEEGEVSDVPGKGAPVQAGLFEPGQEPWRAPQAGMAVIWGRIMEEDSGQPALEAQVDVPSLDKSVFTDFDGYYRLEVPPGTYHLELFYQMFEPETVQGVTVTKGQVNRVDAAMKPQAGAVEEVTIVDEAETQTVEGLALKRQKAVAQGDAVGREEISNGTDSNVAEAAQRVVGATIVNGRFVYVRGLGERYSNALLSGYPLPSPEPDKAAAPLDVFPASVIDSLTVVKTFTPDMPGNFAGGSVQIETRSVPAEPVLEASISGAINTQATFQERLTYPGGSLDWLGLDDGTRSMPEEVPENYRARRADEKPNGERVTDEDLNPVAEALNGRMHPSRSNTPINHGFKVVGGNTWTLGNGQKIGVLGSVNYSHSYQRFKDVILRQFWPDGADPRGYAPRIDYRVDSGEDVVRWGSFGKISYLPSKHHKLTLTGLHSQFSKDVAQLYSGTDQNVLSGEFKATVLNWVERGLSFGMLAGEHEFPTLNDAELEWNASAARAYREQPDRRDTVYQFTDRLDGWVYVDGGESGRHFFAEQTEDSYGGKLDWLQPIIQGDTSLSTKVGTLVNLKERAFSARRFALRRQSSPPELGRLICEGESYALDCPAELFVDDSIGPYLYLQEGTQPGDIYDAHLRVYGTYAMVDVEFDKRLRVATGARVEITDQAINPLSFGGDLLEDDAADLQSTDVLPAVSVIFSATDDVKARFSFSQTLARPQLRELAPFAFADYWGGWLVSGNPELDLTRINNVDARFEYWPSLSDILAFSVFLKEFQNPIEQVLIPAGTSAVLSYRNAAGANVIGVELEARKGLGFLASELSPFSVISNLTLTRSRTEILQQQNFLTSRSRPLINQAPWVFNLALDYESDFGMSARVLYNVDGVTLIQVGTQGLPDVYEHPRHRLDFNISQKFWEHWSAQFSVENMIDDDIVRTQSRELADENIVRRYTTGPRFGLKLGYEL